MDTQELIREAMRELGKRKKTMSKAAVDQRKNAARKSVEARKREHTNKV